MCCFLGLGLEMYDGPAFWLQKQQQSCSCGVGLQSTGADKESVTMGRERGRGTIERIQPMEAEA